MNEIRIFKPDKDGNLKLTKAIKTNCGDRSDYHKNPSNRVIRRNRSARKKSLSNNKFEKAP